MRQLFYIICLLAVTNVFAQQTDTQKTTAIDWGDWDKKLQPQERYGVGIKGQLQNAISELDKSNLLKDSSGVSNTSQVSDNKNIKRKDIKKMKQELRALEEKVKQEIENNEDY
ncbi:hypothetical protein [Pseudoalteromonas sp. G4]|uniref:hypothetical protein n=1 Tax=Pseudoalteromonas sp. G4 TaxID=2992761 RepID=UPI00237E3A77|nr:hypothetical protein [Pseudoalteromonas sp. G4]MDE3273541.1 hypothetical protein [Pseudoalteromonas sp. G4]